ncbi:hypothetical protein DH2020_041274 [Rehmannia glutinosa]|uniref:Small ribosomal subunit protein uS17c n=1 Tax=Rehmannia glutinosa TaxID=99300 RepID=A0ABR0UQN9_REHGL
MVKCIYSFSARLYPPKHSQSTENTKQPHSHPLPSIQNPKIKKMLLTSPPILQFKSLSLTTPFLHGATTTTATHLFKPSASIAVAAPPPSTGLPVIKAMRSLQGRVVCATNDKTVAVEVVRLAPHPKYKRRVRKKKKYQAHDPLNQFKIGDLVQLEKGRPISKTKTFWAVPVPARTGSKPKEGAEPPQELGIPLESAS